MSIKKTSIKELITSKKTNTKLISSGRTENNTKLGNEEQSSYDEASDPLQPENSKTFSRAPNGYTVSLGNSFLQPVSIDKNTVNLFQLNDSQLINFVSNTLHIPTISGTDGAKSADLIINHLKSKNGGVVINPYLGPLINTSDGNTGHTLQDLLNDIQAQLCIELNKLVCVDEGLTVSNVSLPSFSNINPILKSQLGGTQGFELETDSNGNLQAYLYDTFGVDEADTTKESNFTTLLEQIGAIKGLRALWVLQHQRGYKPFLMKTPLKMTLNNPRIGTIIHYISLDNCN